MKRRNTIVKARMGFINQEGTIKMVDIKTNKEQIYNNINELNHLTEVEFCKMTTKKA